MRESNFHFPSVNKACVSITSALYDRRALDCTADLPLVNSLSHLNYLTSSSARIREILTTDGGLERLVRILRTTRVTEDTLHNWKWTMAFQCVVNVGVRGTPEIRQRVVQVGAVPILVEILHAYLLGSEVIRLEQRAREAANSQSAHMPTTKMVDFSTDPGISTPENNAEISDPSSMVVSSHILASGANNSTGASPLRSSSTANAAAAAAAAAAATVAGINPIPVAAPAMLSGAANSSRQQSRRVGEGVHPLARHVAYPDASAPTSVPVADTVGSNSANPPQFLPYSSPAYKYSEQERLQAEYEAARRRLQSINHVMYRHDDVILTLQLLAYLGKMSTQRQLLHECPLLFTQMRHTGGLASQRTTSPLENGSSTAATYTGGNGYASPEDLVYAARAARCSVIANEVAGIPPARRRPGTDGALVDVFSLVERFTLQNTFQPDMVYWSSVAMRNNCRRDESRGSCRQCAYLECQKWERHSNEFAKCRRCRKAKYCSKQCQSKAWQDGHRYWCIERTPSASSNSAVMEGSTSISADIIAPHALSATAVSMQHQPQQQEQQDHYSHTGYQPPPAPHAAGMSSHTAETGVAVGGSNNGMTTTRLATHESYVGDHIAGGSASAIQTAPASLSVPTVPVSLPLDPAGYSQPAGGPMTSNSHSGQHHHPYRQPSASDAHGHALSHPRTRPRHREAGPQ